MDWARILAYITGTVGQELLLQNEYLAAENRILRGQLKGRLRPEADTRRGAALRMWNQTLLAGLKEAAPSFRSMSGER
ncbi:MAG TPA: hypothetical protein VIJ35_17400 [Bradyrhizobium sp.]